MPDSGQIEALKNIMEQIDLLIPPAGSIPADNAPRLRELVRAALALINDLK